MNKIAFTLVATLALLAASAIANDRTPATSHMEAMHQMDGSHSGRSDDHHGRRPPVVVGVPIFVAPPIDYSDYSTPDAYSTLEGFYYYCNNPAGYYPTVPDCPSGWRLVP
jgi:hypothetical protein